MFYKRYFRGNDMSCRNWKLVIFNVESKFQAEYDVAFKALYVLMTSCFLKLLRPLPEQEKHLLKEVSLFLQEHDCTLFRWSLVWGSTGFDVSEGRIRYYNIVTA